jgi:hypothetical protein
MVKRLHIPEAVETAVLVASGRRCCLCFFLLHRKGVRKGQVAHLNHDARDPRSENLVFLCLEHHDEYDGKTSQTKGLTCEEVRTYRDKLYEINGGRNKWIAKSAKQVAETSDAKIITPVSDYERIRQEFPDKLEFTRNPWRFPLWQVANEPEFFAYKAGNRADGVCLIERINLPDGRIVIACIETAGNPGNSITNCVEELCFQVCERFEIPSDRLVWLQHYEYDGRSEWSMVRFGKVPPDGPFEDPSWTDMTPQMWRDLRLKPKRRLRYESRNFHSKLTKLFPWSMEDM